LDHLTSPGLAYSQILVVLVNTVISWIRLADLNPCTTGGVFLFSADFSICLPKNFNKDCWPWPLINCYRFIITVRINVIFIHLETSRIARTRRTHLFKESETRQCEGNERKQGNVVIDESGDIQCFLFLLTIDWR
jgi:hypothetical protein